MKDFLRPLEIEARKSVKFPLEIETRKSAKFLAKSSPHFLPMSAKHFARILLSGLFSTEEKLAPKMGILPFFLSFLIFVATASPYTRGYVNRGFQTVVRDCRLSRG